MHKELLCCTIEVAFFYPLYSSCKARNRLAVKNARGLLCSRLQCGGQNASGAKGRTHSQECRQRIRQQRLATWRFLPVTLTLSLTVSRSFNAPPYSCWLCTTYYRKRSSLPYNQVTRQGGRADGGQSARGRRGGGSVRGNGGPPPTPFTQTPSSCYATLGMRASKEEEEETVILYPIRQHMLLNKSS